MDINGCISCGRKLNLADLKIREQRLADLKKANKKAFSLGSVPIPEGDIKVVDVCERAGCQALANSKELAHMVAVRRRVMQEQQPQQRYR